uniref:GPI transamidase component PIG-S n=1 Tax=Magallana gigas TaxID=29159 RepID=K1PHI6_MAGGI
MPGEEASEEKDKSIQHTAALSFGFICLIIGIPLWWKTTEVYRVNLPYSDIADLSNTKFQFTIDIDVVNLEKSWTDKDLTDLSKLLKANLADDRKVGAIFPKYRVAVRQAAEKQSSDLTSLKTLADLKTVSAEVTEILHSVLVREDALLKSFQNFLGAREPKDKASMRSLSYHQGYDILFTLVNPQPDILDIDWSIKEAVEAYLSPMMLFFTGLRRKPHKDKKNSGFYYEETDLPHTINPLEANLGSHASNNPMLNFIVYVPSRDQHPLHIVLKNGEKVKTNSFLSPQWGGIVVQNLPSPPPNSSLPVKVAVDMKTVMEVFLTQLRLLMDFNIQVKKELQVREVGNDVIREWELDNWLRKKCLENLATSISTLQSLTALLEGISNIVIQDDIGQQVENAVTGIKEAHRHLSSGQIARAFTQSRKALASSEKAFFDPSLLELLYFPEDQKFAIYIPLFLPIGLPILGSLFKAIKWIKTKRKQKPKTE